MNLNMSKYIDAEPDRIYAGFNKNTYLASYCVEKNDKCKTEYLRKDMVIDAIKLAYGKVSMNPFDCSEAFEELLNKVGYEIY